MPYYFKQLCLYYYLRINNTYTFVRLNEEVEFFCFFSDHNEN